jgi:hypothetical protein
VDAFPIPSPNDLQPAHVVDANVVSNDINYSQWKKEAGQNLSSKIRGVVLALPASEVQAALKECVDPHILSLSPSLRFKSIDWTRVRKSRRFYLS